MKENWTLVIKPQEKLWSVDFREIYRLCNNPDMEGF